MPRGRPRKPRLSRLDAAVDAMVPFGFREGRVRKVVKELLQAYGGDDGWPFIESYSYKELIEAILRDIEENGEDDGHENANRSKDTSIDDDGGVGTSSRVSDTQQAESRRKNIQADVPRSSRMVSSSSRIHIDRILDLAKKYSTLAEAGEITLPSEEDGIGCKTILQDQTSSLVEQQIPEIAHEDDADFIDEMQHSAILDFPLLSNIRSQSPSNSLPTLRHWPCYGWIESDEEDPDDFIRLSPAHESETTALQDLWTIPDDGKKSERKRKSRWDVAPDFL